MLKSPVRSDSCWALHRKPGQSGGRVLRKGDSPRNAAAGMRFVMGSDGADSEGGSLANLNAAQIRSDSGAFRRKVSESALWNAPARSCWRSS